jgi:hypothetical protein
MPTDFRTRSPTGSGSPTIYKGECNKVVDRGSGRALLGTDYPYYLRGRVLAIVGSPEGVEGTRIGVHAPEFGFEKGRANVHNALRDLNVTYPVAIDSNHRFGMHSTTNTPLRSNSSILGCSLFRSPLGRVLAGGCKVVFI